MKFLLPLLLLAAVAAIAAWRVSVSRRHAADLAAEREKAALAMLLAARKRAQRKTPAADTAPPEQAESARARADRVIATETARRVANARKAENMARADAERRATEAARAALALEKTLPLHDLPTAPINPPVVARPAAPVAAARPVAPPAPAPTIKTAAETVIMLVDDSKMVRVKSSRLLAAHGYQVMLAVDGLDALRQLEAGLPDLVITDVDMPEMDGFGLTNALRGNPATSHIPIVMITSAEDRHREEALRVGVGLTLGKPYPEDELIAHIRSFRFVAGAQKTRTLAPA